MEQKILYIIQCAKDAYFNKGKFIKINFDTHPRLLKYLQEHTPVHWDTLQRLDDIHYDSLVDLVADLKIEVGATPTHSKQKLPFYMGSLDKVCPDTVDAWFANHKPPYILMDKADGVSIGIQYSQGKVAAYTRGNGVIGQDVSHLIPYLNLPEMDGEWLLRGELILKTETFVYKWRNTFENARNMVAGIVQRKKATEAWHDLDAIFYECVSPRGVPSRQLQKLKQLGFKVIPYTVVTSCDAQTCSDYYNDRRVESEYAIDGLVLQSNVQSVATTSGNSSVAVAFKDMRQVECATAQVVAVEWNVSKHGKLAPVVVVCDPNTKGALRLSGTKVDRVSAFNAKFIQDSKIGAGAVVEVRKRGEIIPHIERVLVPALYVQMPDAKIVGEYAWNSSGVDLVLSDCSNSEQVQVRRLSHFFKTLEVDCIGIGIVQKLYQHGFNSIPKLLQLTVKDLCQIEKIQKTLATKLFTNMNTAISNCTLPQMMDASGIFGQNFGTRRCTKILDSIPNALKLSTATLTQQLLEVEGFSEKLAQQFVLHVAEFNAFVQEINFVPKTQTTAKLHTLDGIAITLTGFRDKALSATIEAHGGNEIQFSKRTQVLLVLDHSTNNNKVEKAKVLGIPVLTVPEFFQKYQLETM